MTADITRRTTGRRLTLLLSASMLVLAALCSFAARSQARCLFWDNYDAEPVSVSFSSTDGTGGGALNLGVAAIDEPEGMAYDPVSNRLFVASEGGGVSGQIVAVNLDGSGAVPFTAPGAPIDGPEGVVVDPTRRMIFWINASPQSISWALLDGSAGGVLNTGGPVVGSRRLGIDPVAGRVYWHSEPDNSVRLPTSTTPAPQT